MKEKLIASFLAALTVLTPIVSATAVGDFPTFLGANGVLDAYVVVGSTAATADVVGAIDVALILATQSYIATTVSGAAAVVDGIVREVNICDAVYTDCNLSKQAGSYIAFPSGNLTNLHYSTLKDSSYRWESSDYAYKEYVDVIGLLLRHKLTEDKINGTEKIVVGTAGAVKYNFLFSTEFNFTSKDATKGTISSPQYTYPLKIKLLGKEFVIVGVSATKVKMLGGSVGTATDKLYVEYGDYRVYAPIGGTNTLQVEVKDKTDNSVETLVFTGLTSGTAATKSTTKTSPILDITVTSFGTLTDGTVLGADLVVGPSGTTTKEYDSSADVETTSATANDKFDSANPRWGIRYLPTCTTDVTCDRKIGANSVIQVLYQPKEPEYLKAGESISLPNNYAELKFEGWNTDKFVTITIKPYGPATVYTVTNKSTVALSEAYGFEISSEGATSIGSTSGNYFDKGYILFGKIANSRYPVAVGFYDKVSGLILVSDSVPSANDDSTEYKYDYNLTGQFTYNFGLSYGGVGEASFRVATAFTSYGSSVTVDYIRVGVAGSETIATNYVQKSSPTWSITSAPQFSLGTTSGSKDSYEINVTTEDDTARMVDASGKSQEIVDNSGILVQSTSSSTGSNALVMKIPSKTLGAKVFFGKKTTTTTEGGTYNKIVPVTSSVAVLDSEVTNVHKAKNLVLVGGPCKNTLVADLSTKVGYTCQTWPTRKFGLVKAIDGAFTTGKVALVVAGTTRTETRLACSVLQQYATKLAGQTVSAVEVTGTTGAEVVTPVTTTT